MKPITSSSSLISTFISLIEIQFYNMQGQNKSEPSIFMEERVLQSLVRYLPTINL